MYNILDIKNKIIHGDNLLIMCEFPSEFIDLIYLDPPFFTQKEWTKNGNSFSDKFKNIEEYIAWMRERLMEMHRILKPTGSIYLHCDHHAFAYLKILMSEIFENYQTTIVWQRGPSGFVMKSLGIFPEISDYILVYTKSDNYIYNSIEMTNIWKDIQRLNVTEYPTQKPEELLERIIKTSSNINDIVFDPFCGSGTTCIVAKRQARTYIGIDVSIDAIELTNKNLKKINGSFLQFFS